MSNKISQKKGRPSREKHRGGGRKTMRCSRGGAGDTNADKLVKARKLEKQMNYKTTQLNREIETLTNTLAKKETSLDRKEIEFKTTKNSFTLERLQKQISDLKEKIPEITTQLDDKKRENEANNESQKRLDKLIVDLKNNLATEAAAEKAAKEKAALEKAAKEKAAKEKAAAEKASAEKASAEKAALEKAASEKAAKENEDAEKEILEIMLVNDHLPDIILQKYEKNPVGVLNLVKEWQKEYLINVTPKDTELNEVMSKRVSSDDEPLEQLMSKVENEIKENLGKINKSLIDNVNALLVPVIDADVVDPELIPGLKPIASTNPTSNPNKSISSRTIAPPPTKKALIDKPLIEKRSLMEHKRKVEDARLRFAADEHFKIWNDTVVSKTSEEINNFNNDMVSSKPFLRRTWNNPYIFETHDSDQEGFNEDDDDDDDFVIESNIPEVSNTQLDEYYHNISFFDRDTFNIAIDNYSGWGPVSSDRTQFNIKKWEDEWIDDIINPMYDYISNKNPDEIHKLYDTHKVTINAAINDLLENEDVLIYDTIDDVLSSGNNTLITEFKWWVISDANISKYASEILDEICKKMFYDTNSEPIYAWLRSHVLYNGFMSRTESEGKRMTTIKEKMEQRYTTNVIDSIQYKQVVQFLDNVVRRSFIIWAEKLIEGKDHGPVLSNQGNQLGGAESDAESVVGSDAGSVAGSDAGSVESVVNPQPTSRLKNIGRYALNTIKSTSKNGLDKLRRSELARNIVKLTGKTSNRNVIENMLPSLYYWIIYDINGRLKTSTRKYIYDIMAENASINTPEHMRNTLFDVHKYSLLQKDIEDDKDIDNIYDGVDIVSFDERIVDKLKVGSIVKANIHGKGKLIDGTIKAINNNGTFSIEYKNGAKDININKSSIQMLGNSNTWETPMSRWDMCITYKPEGVTTNMKDLVVGGTTIVKRNDVVPIWMKTLYHNIFVKKGITYYFTKGSSEERYDDYKYGNTDHDIVSMYGKHTKVTNSTLGSNIDPYSLFGNHSEKIWEVCWNRVFRDFFSSSPSGVTRDKPNINIKKTDGNIIVSKNVLPVAVAVAISDNDSIDSKGSPSIASVYVPSSEEPDTVIHDKIISELESIYDEIFEAYITENDGKEINITSLVNKSDLTFADRFSEIIDKIYDSINTPSDDDMNDIFNTPASANNFNMLFLYLHGAHSSTNHTELFASINGSIPCNDPVISNITTLNNQPDEALQKDMPSVDVCNNKDMYGILYKLVSLSSLETIDDPDEKIQYITTTGKSSSPYMDGSMDIIIQPDTSPSSTVYSETKKEMMEKYISPIGDDNARPKVDVERMGTWNIGYNLSDASTKDISPHKIIFTDAMRAKMMAFFDKNSKGILRSEKMKQYIPEIMTKLENFQSITLANHESGYIYRMSANMLHFNFSSTFNRSHNPIAVYLEFSGVHNNPKNPTVSPYVIYREDALLWLDPHPSVKKTVEIGNPRLYHGMMKYVWSNVSPPIPSLVADDDDDDDDEPDDRPVPVRIGGTVFTTVPGYQNMQISPSMFGIPKDKSRREKIIRINPTVKLSHSVVNMAPEEDRKRQFFDYGLFYTLNSRAANQELMGISNISFKKSVKSHIIDNNIKITIDTLFAPGTVIYLGSEPYTVYSANFDETKWRLGPSDAIEAELNVENVMNAQMLNIQNKAAISEMQSMPDVLKVGDGLSIAEAIPVEYQFVKESDDVKGSDKDKINPNNLKLSTISDRLPTPITNSTSSTELTVVPKKRIDIIQNPILDVPRLPNKPYIQVPTPPHEQWVPPKVVGVNDPLMNDVIVPMRDFFLYGPTMEYIVENNNEVDDKRPQVFNREMNYRTIKKDLTGYGIPKETVENIANHLKKTPNYYDMLDTLNASARTANLVDLFRIKKKTNAGTFNISNYKRNTIDGGDHLLQIIRIAGDGNCFFTCISHALNIHNYSNKKSPYVFHTTDAESGGREVVRGGTDFTQEFIRWAVVNKYRQTPGLMAVEILNSCVHIDGPNDEFVNAEITRIEKIEHISPIAVTKLNDIKKKINIMRSRDHRFGDDGWNAEIRAGQDINELRQDAVGKTLFLEYDKDSKGLTYPKTEEDAYKLLMSSHYYAQTTIIYMIQRLFTIKPIIIGKRDKEHDAVNLAGLVNDGIYGDWKVRATRTYFKTEEPISIEEDLDDNIDKVVFILQKDVHYSLFAFGPDLETQSNKPDSTTKTRRKRATNSDIDNIIRRTSDRIANQKKSSGGGTRRRRYIKGGGNPNHVVIFNLNAMNSNAPSEETNTSDILGKIPKTMIFDSGPTQIPNYMVMLMYSNYNMIRGAQGNFVSRSIMQNYNEYRLFYTEFLIIDALIESMATVSTNSIDGDISSDSSSVIDVNSSAILDRFIKEYNYVFAPNNLWSHQTYLPMIYQYHQANRIDDDDYGDVILESQRVTHIDDLTRRGGAPRNPIPGRNAMNNVTSSSLVAPNVATAVPMMNTAIAMDPSNVLSEHVLRIMNDDSSTLSFKLDVHLILAPGDNGIGIADKVGYACESSKQDMSRSWSEITGKPYYPTARKE